MDYLTSMWKAQIEQSEEYDRIWEEWRLNCNKLGVEIYYSMDDAKEVPGWEEEGTTMLVGQYKERPCSQHFLGHICNPPRYARITNLSCSSLS